MSIKNYVRAAVACTVAVILLLAILMLLFVHCPAIRPYFDALNQAAVPFFGGAGVILVWVWTSIYRKRADAAKPETEDLKTQPSAAARVEETTSQARPATPVEIDADKFLRLASIDGLAALYAFSLSKNAAPFTLKHVFCHHLKRPAGYPHAYGFVIACRAAGLMWFTASRGKWKIHWIHSDIEAKILESLEGAIDHRWRDKVDDLRYIPAAIRECF